MKMTKTQLRRFIIKEAKKVLNEESVADKDTAAANKLRKELEAVIVDIDNTLTKINTTLTSAGSPGLRWAFMAAIEKGTQGFGKFSKSRALSTLNKYYINK